MSWQRSVVIFTVCFLAYSNGQSALCPSGWVYNLPNDLCYLFPNVALNFNDATNYCANQTGTLLSILSATQYNNTLTLLNNQASPDLQTLSYWLGLVPSTYYWNWQTGLYLNYTKWLGSSVLSSSNTCVGWQVTPTANGWIGVPCKYQQPFVCQRENLLCKPQRFNGTQGNFTSWNYPAYYDPMEVCSYNIIVPRNNSINITFTTIDLSYYGYDYIDIYDGASNLIQRITYLSNGRTLSIIAPGNNVTVVLDAYYLYPSYFRGRGFVVSYLAVPIQPTVYTTPTGVLSSPNFPSNYSNSDDRIYVINPGLALTNIELTFTTFFTELYYDKLYIYDGAEDTAPLIKSYNGQLTTPFTVSSTQNAVRLVWYTDASVARPGWNLTWTTLPFIGPAPTVTLPPSLAN